MKKKLVKINDKHFIDIDKISVIHKIKEIEKISYYIFIDGAFDVDIMLSESEFEKLMEYLDITDVNQGEFLTKEDVDI